MSGLQLLPCRFNVDELVKQLAAAEQLWNDFDLRTNHPQSPHRELDDIFVRYNARENFPQHIHPDEVHAARTTFNGPHDAVWWSAAQELPAVKPIVFELMRNVEGERLGMVLITRIPAGQTCYSHTDNGWHAGHYDKFAVQLASAPGQSFHVEEESLEALPGECYWFDNSRPHHVLNLTAHARITMIVCIRNRFTGVRV